MSELDLNKFAAQIVGNIQNTLSSPHSAPDPYAVARNLISTGATSTPVNVTPYDNSRSPGLGSRILDLLSRPRYAVMNFVNEGAKATHGVDMGQGLNEIQAPDYNRAVSEGVSGKAKTSFSDVLQSAGNTSAVSRGVFGLAGDLVGDPLSYVGIPGASKIASLVKGKNALDAERDLAATARANVADDVRARMDAKQAAEDKAQQDFENFGDTSAAAEDFADAYAKGNLVPHAVPAKQGAHDYAEHFQSEIHRIANPENQKFKNLTSLADSLVGKKSTGLEGSIGRRFEAAPDGLVETEVRNAQPFSPLNKSLDKVARSAKNPYALDKPRTNLGDITVAPGELLGHKVAADRVATALDDLNSLKYPQVAEGIDPLYKATEGTWSFTRRQEDYSAWAEKYKAIMDPADFDFLKRARNEASFTARANQIMQKQLDKGVVRDIDDFVKFAKEGNITEDSVARMMNATGAQSLEEIPAKAKEIFDRYATTQGKAAKAATPMPNKMQSLQKVIDEASAARAKTNAEAEVAPAVESGAATAVAKATLPDGQVAAKAVKKAKPAAARIGAYTPRMQTDDLLKLTTEAANKFKGHTTVNSAGKSFPTSGGKLAHMKYEDVVPQLRAAQDELEAAGMHPHIKSSGKARSEWPVGLADIYEALPEFAKKYQFNWKTKIFPSEQQAGVAKLFDTELTTGMSMESRVNTIVKAMKEAGPGKTDEKLLQAAAAEMIIGQEALKESRRLAMLRQQGIDLENATKLSNAMKEDIVDVASDPMVAGSEKAQMYTNIGADISRAGDTIGASEAAKTQAVADSAETLAKVTEPNVLPAAKSAQYVQKARTGTIKATADDIRRATQTFGDKAADDAEKLLDPDLLNDMDVVFASRMDGRHRAFTEFMGSATGIKRNELREIFRSGAVAASTKASLYNRGLNDLAKTITPPNRDAAFTMLRQGRELTPEIIRTLDPEVVDAYNRMRPFFDAVYDVSTNEGNSLFGLLFRHGDDVDEVNKTLKEFGLDHQFDLKSAGGNWTDMANQWRDWEIADPLEFMQKTFSAGQHIGAKRAVTQEHMQQFGVRSATRPGEDFVKLDVGSMKELGPYMDPALWYPRRAAEAMLDLDRFVSSATSFKGEKGLLAGFMNHVVDPVMSIWKPWVTIARPGHHLRNIFGDLNMTRLDTKLNHNGTKSYHQDAFKIMAAVGRVKKDPQALAAMLKGEDVFAGTNAHILSLKGKDMNAEQVYRSALNHGLLPEYRLGQDLIHDIGEEAGARTEAVRKALVENRLMVAMGKGSELYSHELRLAHYIGLLKTDKFVRQFKTYDEAIQGAAERVRRFHPDSTGLVPGELKYARRLIPFYSWLRQAIPVVAATAFVRPGRLTEIPKAFYNAQVAMGQNPDSMVEPFDNTKMYPSFIRDNLTGPVFGSVGLNLGTPTEGVLGDTLNGNVGRNILSMLNPVVKTPVELVSGTNMGTGAKILDKSDYVDSNLPVVNQVSAISGISPTGTIANAVTGGGPVPDPQRAVQVGNKQKFWNQNLANFFLGLGIDDYEKGNYGRIAVRELGGTS